MAQHDNGMENDKDGNERRVYVNMCGVGLTYRIRGFVY